MRNPASFGPIILYRLMGGWGSFCRFPPIICGPQPTEPPAEPYAPFFLFLYIFYFSTTNCWPAGLRNHLRNRFRRVPSVCVCPTFSPQLPTCSLTSVTFFKNLQLFLFVVFSTCIPSGPYICMEANISRICTQSTHPKSKQKPTFV